MQATAAAAAKESSSSSPSPSSSPQHTDSADTELDDCCPICLDSWREPAIVIPCLHRFCYACILQWSANKTECPFCKGTMTSILHSVRADDDFVEHVLAPPVTPPSSALPARAAHREPDAPNFQQPETRPWWAAARDVRHLMGSFQLPNWMSYFSINPAIHQTLQSWVYQNLELLFGTRRDQRAHATEQQRRREQHRGPRQQDTHAATGQAGSPSSPAPGPTRFNMDEMPGTSSTAIGRGSAPHPSIRTNIHRDQQESQEEPGRPRPGTQYPPNSTGGSDPSSGGLRRPPKRSASSPEGSSVHKRPRH